MYGVTVSYSLITPALACGIDPFWPMQTFEIETNGFHL